MNQTQGMSQKYCLRAGTAQRRRCLRQRIQLAGSLRTLLLPGHQTRKRKQRQLRKPELKLVIRTQGLIVPQMQELVLQMLLRQIQCLVLLLEEYQMAWLLLKYQTCHQPQAVEDQPLHS